MLDTRGVILYTKRNPGCVRRSLEKDGIMLKRHRIVLAAAGVGLAAGLASGGSGDSRPWTDIDHFAIWGAFPIEDANNLGVMRSYMMLVEPDEGKEGDGGRGMLPERFDIGLYLGAGDGHQGKGQPGFDAWGTLEDWQIVQVPGSLAYTVHDLADLSQTWAESGMELSGTMEWEHLWIAGRLRGTTDNTLAVTAIITVIVTHETSDDPSVFASVVFTPVTVWADLFLAHEDLMELEDSYSGRKRFGGGPDDIERARQGTRGGGGGGRGIVKTREDCLREYQAGITNCINIWAAERTVEKNRFEACNRAIGVWDQVSNGLVTGYSWSGPCGTVGAGIGGVAGWSQGGPGGGALGCRIGGLAGGAAGAATGFGYGVVTGIARSKADCMRLYGIALTGTDRRYGICQSSVKNDYAECMRRAP